MKTFRGILVAFASLAVALTLVGSSGVPAAAQVPPRPVLIVNVSGSPEPAASAGSVIYAITVKNDGTTKALNVVVTVPMPAGTAFVKCTMVLIVGSPSDPCTCTPTQCGANGIVTVNLGKIKAHLEPRINLTLTMPSVSAVSTIEVTAKANGDDVTDSDDVTATTTVLPPGSFVTYLPSENVGPIACGGTLTPEAFGTDTTAKLSGPLGCTSGSWGLKITASGKTLDLNRFNIFWNAGSITAGSVGILVSNATGVTIIGGGTNTGSGIENFDWCVKDEGQSKKLSINSLRCFKARTAGIDIASKKATITGVKVDRVTGTATTTAVPPGGVGIRTRADKASIQGSRVLKAGTVGIWVSGSDSNGDGVVAQIDDSSIEDSPGIGLLLDEGPHSAKFMDVSGDELLVTDVTKPKDGVVVGPTGIGNRLDSIIVKEHGGNGFVITGTGTVLLSSEVEAVGLDGYVVAGSGSNLSGNTVTEARRGFVVSGPATCEAGVVCNLLNTNDAENLDDDAFVVTGEGASLENNTAQGNVGVAFRIGGGGGSYDTNSAEINDAHGFVITGSNNTFKANTAENNIGIGFKVTGSGNHFNTNTASKNDDDGANALKRQWVIAPGQIDDGGNKSSSAVFPIPPEGGTFN